MIRLLMKNSWSLRRSCQFQRSTIIRSCQFQRSESSEQDHPLISPSAQSPVQPAQERPRLSQPVRPQGNALDSEASAGCPGSVPCGICARTGLRHYVVCAGCLDTVCLGCFWACNACIETFCIVCVRRHHCDIARQAVCHSKPLYAIWEYDEAQRYPCQYFVSNTCTKCDRTGLRHYGVCLECRKIVCHECLHVRNDSNNTFCVDCSCRPQQSCF